MPLGLNLDLSGIETKFPSLAPGKYKCTITKVEGKPTTKDDQQFNLDVEFQLEEPAMSTDSKPIPPGFKFHYNISLPSDRAPEFKEMRERSTATFIDAALGSTKENRPNLNDALLPTFVGKTVQVSIKMRKDKDDVYGDSQVGSVAAIPTA